MDARAKFVAALLTLAAIGVAVPAYAAQWEERTLFTHEISRDTEEQGIYVASVEGAPREDGKFYDITLSVSDQPRRTVTLETAGTLQDPFYVEVGRVRSATTTVRMRVFVRRDASMSPSAEDPAATVDWLTTDGRHAVLGVTLSKHRNGEVVAERTVLVPFVGQLIP